MVVTGTDGVVQRRDALVIGRAGVLHLQGRLTLTFINVFITLPSNSVKEANSYLVDDPLDQVELPLQRGVQQQGQRVELDPEAVADALRVDLLQVGAFLLPDVESVVNPGLDQLIV